jgi:hypothetical protein
MEKDHQEASEGALVETAKTIGKVVGKTASALGLAKPAKAKSRAGGSLQKKNKQRLPRKQKKAAKKAAQKSAKNATRKSR